MMKRDEIVAGLRWLRPESGDFACDGCGWENSCGARGCQIMREAADMLENDESQAVALRRELELKRAQLDCAAACADRIHRQNKELRDAAAQVTKLAAEDYSIHRMVELMRADKDGRLVVLPHCKLGDTVYWLHDKKITECRVYRIQESTKGVQIAIKSTVSHGVFSVDDYFGKTIFLTREEAEKALGKKG